MERCLMDFWSCKITKTISSSQIFKHLFLQTRKNYPEFGEIATFNFSKYLQKRIDLELKNFPISLLRFVDSLPFFKPFGI